MVFEGDVRSADGTTIAFDKSGAGPALVIVDGAGCFREFGSQRPLARLLEADFTVYLYDRRGRGRSTDTVPYAIEREVEDLAALIDEAGGSAFVYAVSSGALLALQGAASGLPIPKLALFEPPIGTDEERSVDVDLTAALAALVDAGSRGDAVEHFQTAIGVPPQFLTKAGPARDALESVAHTLVYDCKITDGTSFELVRTVTTPTLVLDSESSNGSLTGWAAAVGEALPNGTHGSLAGQWHGVDDEDLAVVLAGFFGDG
jgi:pimeloyl-ACP methyl ester carboxylesterase